MASPDRSDGNALAHRTNGLRRVVVAGDVTIDWNLARTRKLVDGGTAWNADDRAEAYSGLGGAAVLARLVEEVGTAWPNDGLAVEVCGPPVVAGSTAPGDPRFHHSYAIWSQFPRRRGDRDRSVWRVEEFLGLDRSRAQPAVPEAGDPASSPADAALVVIDDANLGFRDSPNLWPSSLRLTADDPRRRRRRRAQPPWVVLKMAGPVADGALWQQLLGHHAERLVVVMTLSDLRLSDVKISRELSWERTAGDLARELVRHPAVNGLARCAHVVVSFGTGGAVLLSRPGAVSDGSARLDQPDCHVFFDPESIENSWAEQYPGAMIGYTTCLVAGIARELLLAPDAPDVHRGVTRGLAAERALHLAGYGDPDGEDRPGRPDLPRARNRRTAAERRRGVRDGPHRAAGPRLVVDPGVALPGRSGAGRGGRGARRRRNGPLGVPLGRFGKLLTLDRGEIEGFRSIRALMREYDSEPAPTPAQHRRLRSPGRRASPSASRQWRSRRSTATASRT